MSSLETSRESGVRRVICALQFNDTFTMLMWGGKLGAHSRCFLALRFSRPASTAPASLRSARGDVRTPRAADEGGRDGRVGGAPRRRRRRGAFRRKAGGVGATEKRQGQPASTGSPKSTFGEELGRRIGNVGYLAPTTKRMLRQEPQRGRLQATPAPAARNAIKGVRVRRRHDEGQVHAHGAEDFGGKATSAS